MGFLPFYIKPGIFQFPLSNGETQRVRGWVSGHFGIHKREQNDFSITHLKTGKRLFSFCELELAKQFVEIAEKEEFPILWKTSDEGALNKNKNKCFEIKREIENGS